MAYNIVVPPLSESVVEATVAAWSKKVGDSIKAGDVVVVLETDKVSLEVTADGDGVLQEILHDSGADVGAGAILGIVSGDAVVAPAQPVATPAPTQATVPAQQASSTNAPKATPVAKRVADANAVDLQQVAARDGGRITKTDVQDHLNKAQLPAQTPTPALPTGFTFTVGDANPRETRAKMSRRRRTIAQRLLEAKQATAMLTTFNEIDMSSVMAIRAKRKDAFQKKFNVGLGFSSFFVKATIGALKAFPQLNAEIVENDIITKHYYDIGMAIGSEEGLVVPVLRDADRMSFAQIEQQIKDYAEQVRKGTLGIEALMGGTFTITNGGVFGSLMSTPILNYPQVGILGLHAIKERPVVVGGEIVARPMMYVALSYDHRIVDGREAVQFLVKLKDLIEDPESLLIEG